MSRIFQAYGRTLTSIFGISVLAWALLLIILPQFSMLERAMTPPKRQLDSSIAGQLGKDADLCVSVLQTHDTAPSRSKSKPRGAFRSLGLIWNAV